MKEERPKYIEINVEMVIGLRYYPGKFTESFSFVNGYSKHPKKVIRFGLGALGRYQPHDIGKRYYFASGNVENDEQVTRRTGLSFEQRKRLGQRMIAEAKKRYKGETNIWGLTI